jgi:uncharacterized protein (DUF1800 family)
LCFNAGQMRYNWPRVSFVCVLVGAACAPTPPPAPHYTQVPESAAPLDTNSGDIAMLNRISWGAGTSSAQLLAAEGLDGYLQSQLHPSADDGLPNDARIQIAAMDITQESLLQINDEIRALREAARAAKDTPGYDEARKAYRARLGDYARQAATRSLLRDLYSKNQLKEQLTWFWMNHFNVSQNKNEIRAFVGDYEENAIRPRVLGKFRDLLAATVFHPAMLQYLDNAQNAAGHINENYAREIMELHTLGVGSGYTQKDVQELARILTGVGINLSGKMPNVRPELRSQYRAGNLFEFNPNRHDYGDKIFLGTPIKGEGLKEVAEAIAILSAQPATAHHISSELAQYFCCDTLPVPLVDAMSATFSRTDGDIAAVLETMFAAPEFKASLSRKFKDPIHFALSSLRAAYGDTVILNPQPLFGWLNRMSESLYAHETPDGYALDEAAWSGPGEMEARFEIARQIGLGHSGLLKLPSDTAQEPAPAPDIGQTRYYQAIASTLGPATSGALAQAKSPADWNMLFLSSPEFMHR